MNSANSILVIILLAVTAIIPQDRLAEQLTKAKALYSHEEYFNSITELKRLIFFDNKKQYSYTANELIGECYKKGAKLTEALSYFTRAEIATTIPDEVYNRSEEHTSELQSLRHLVCRLLLEKKK